MEFQKFNKITRLNRNCCITEKIDGTNVQIVIMTLGDIWDSTKDCTIVKAQDFIDNFCLYQKYLDINGTDDQSLYLFAGSRNRWLKIGSDNHGFASWVKENALTLMGLGEGRHYGEWWGGKIQRGYGIKEKRFSLFNVKRWAKIGAELKQYPTNDPRVFVTQEYAPECCDVVPVLYEGLFDTPMINKVLYQLNINGSVAVKGYPNPEGIVAFHKHSGILFKVTVKNDEKPKSQK